MSITRTPTRRIRWGGPEGNEILTAATAVTLTVLLVIEGITIIWLGQLRTWHMLVGLALIPPVGLKLASTGYRFVRYYTGSRLYQAKGPPQLPLRLLAPVLVVTTVGVFATGVVLLLDGRHADTLVLLHKVFFIVWGAVFGVHFLAYVPRVLRSLRDDWRRPRRTVIPAAGLRATLVATTLGAGVALAAALLPTIHAWHGQHH